jgi:hypothetical protein
MKNLLSAAGGFLMPDCLLEEAIALFSLKAAKSQRKALFCHLTIDEIASSGHDPSRNERIKVTSQKIGVGAINF